MRPRRRNSGPSCDATVTDVESESTLLTQTWCTWRTVTEGRSIVVRHLLPSVGTRNTSAFVSGAQCVLIKIHSKTSARSSHSEVLTPAERKTQFIPPLAALNTPPQRVEWILLCVAKMPSWLQIEKHESLLLISVCPEDHWRPVTTGHWHPRWIAFGNENQCEENISTFQWPIGQLFFFFRI